MPSRGIARAVGQLGQVCRHETPNHFADLYPCNRPVANSGFTTDEGSRSCRRNTTARKKSTLSWTGVAPLRQTVLGWQRLALHEAAAAAALCRPPHQRACNMASSASRLGVRNLCTPGPAGRHDPLAGLCVGRLGSPISHTRAGYGTIIEGGPMKGFRSGT